MLLEIHIILQHQNATKKCSGEPGSANNDWLAGHCNALAKVGLNCASSIDRVTFRGVQHRPELQHLHIFD